MIKKVILLLILGALSFADVSSIYGIPWASIQSVGGIAVASIGSIGGQTATAGSVTWNVTYWNMEASGVDYYARYTLVASLNMSFSANLAKFGSYSATPNDATSYFYTAKFPVITADYTIAGWVYIKGTTLAQDCGIFGITKGAGTSGVSVVASNGAQKQYGWSSVASSFRASGYTTTPNQWVYVELSREGPSTRMFIGGVQTDYVASDSSVYGGAYSQFWVGATGDNGYANWSAAPNLAIDDVHVLLGKAEHTANYTPPTSAYLP